MKDRILIKKSLIPYRFQIALPDELWTLEFQYNECADLFVVALYQREQLICAGEPLIYDMPLFADFYQPKKFPALKIVPLDESGKMNRVTWDNFGETVFLTVIQEMPTEEEAQ